MRERGGETERKETKCGSWSAAGSLPHGHVLTFCFVSFKCLCLPMHACIGPHTLHFNHCFVSIKHKGKRMCNGVNSLSVYFNSSEL